MYVYMHIGIYIYIYIYMYIYMICSPDSNSNFLIFLLKLCKKCYNLPRLHISNIN